MTMCRTKRISMAMTMAWNRALTMVGLSNDYDYWQDFGYVSGYDYWNDYGYEIWL